MTTAVPSLEWQEVLAALGSSNRGLSADEAAARRAETGANHLPAARRRSMLAEFGAQFANMFAVVLMVAAGITFGAYALGNPRDSASLVLAIGILGVVLLNAVIGFAQEHAAERTAEALQALVPATARVIRDGELTEIPAVDLVPGDLVMLDAGDAISAVLHRRRGLARPAAELSGREVVVMRIIVTGGTGLAEQVADALHRAGDEVTVIDTEPGRESALARVGLRAIYGDVLVPSTLEAAGALKADVLVACTQSDEDNLVISLLAKKRFNVPRVIARVNDPASDELFDQAWGVDALVSPATSLVSMIRPES